MGFRETAQAWTLSQRNLEFSDKLLPDFGGLQVHIIITWKSIWVLQVLRSAE